MKLEYIIEKESLLTYQLYFASQSSRITRQRRIARFLISGLFLVLAPLYALVESFFGAVLFASLGVLWLFFYPYYSRWRFRGHYERHIDDALRGMINRNVAISLDSDEANAETILVLEDESARTQIKLDHIESIVRIPGYVLLMLRTGQGITLPENQLGKDLETLMKKLTDLADISVLEKPAWKWK